MARAHSAQQSFEQHREHTQKLFRLLSWETVSFETSIDPEHSALGTAKNAHFAIK